MCTQTERHTQAARRCVVTYDFKTGAHRTWGPNTRGQCTRQTSPPHEPTASRGAQGHVNANLGSRPQEAQNRGARERGDRGEGEERRKERGSRWVSHLVDGGENEGDEKKKRRGRVC